jgi:hypothetical protein
MDASSNFAWGCFSIFLVSGTSIPPAEDKVSPFQDCRPKLLYAALDCANRDAPTQQAQLKLGPQLAFDIFDGVDRKVPGRLAVRAVTDSLLCFPDLRKSLSL